MPESKGTVDLVWVGKGLVSSYKLPVYFASTGAILSWFNDYMMDFAKPKMRAKETPQNTFEARARDLKAFAVYLCQNKLDWKAFNDELFLRFIESELLIVKTWQKTQKYEQEDPVGANINVNRKIHAVYDFYEWAQSERLVQGVIGPECPIHTTLSTDHDSQGRRNDTTSRKGASKKKKIRRSVSFRLLSLPAPSSRKTIKHYATDEDINLLNKQLANETENYYVAERNLLFTAILHETGLRAGSAASLLASQIPTFEQLKRETNTDREYPVRPLIQKRGYQNTFTLSYSLCMEIRRFIDGPRTDFLVSLGISNSMAEDALFLSAKDGKAMTSKALRDIVRTGFRKIGITERRTGAHAIRRLRLNQFGMDIIRRKRRAGGLVTPEIVTQEIAKKAGQSSLSSYTAYENSVNAMEAETDAAAIAKLRNDLEFRENRLALKEAELALREKKLQGAHYSTTKPERAVDDDDDLEEF